MPDIMLLLTCLSYELGKTNQRRLARIAEAMLSMTGRVTMLGLSRWSGQGGSYRTLQRFFHSTIIWPQLNWALFQSHLSGGYTEWVMAADEVVVTKSGKKTYGLERFFSSIYGKTVPGLCFFSLSLINVKRRSSHPMLLEPIIKEAAASCPKGTSSVKEKKSGRPKGSRNRNLKEVELSPYLQFAKGLINQVLTRIDGWVLIRYFVFDGAFGHNSALQMVQQLKLHLISKLRYNSALYLPYDGPYSGRGRRRKYGERLDYRNLPQAYLKSTSTEDHIRTDIYQMPVFHKKFADLLNVVIIVKTNQTSGAHSHVILFSSDMELGYEKLVDYYRLRFQIEFNFRDAKQYWGLEDFMTVKQTPVYNSANLAMLMVNLSYILRQSMREECPDFSVNDLKAQFRGRQYVLEALKLLPEMPDAVIIDQIIQQAANRGRINQIPKAA